MYQRQTQTSSVTTESSTDIHITSSGSSNSEAQEELDGTWMDETRKGEDCACLDEGILTGMMSDEKTAPGGRSEERYQPDVAFEEEWGEWIHYDPQKLEAELAQVEAFNAMYDGVNNSARDNVDTRFASREQAMGEEASDEAERLGLDATPGSADWQAEKDTLDQQSMDMWGGSASGTWSGFEGDLEDEGFDRRAEGATWAMPNVSISEMFGDAFVKDEEKDGDYQIPVKGYQKFADENGKMASLPLFGFAMGEAPATRWTDFELYVQTDWCADSHVGVRKFTGNGKGRKTTRVRKGGTDGWHECEAVVRRDTRSDKDTPQKRGREGADDFIARAKTTEAKAYRDMHQERLDYLDEMAKVEDGATPSWASPPSQP